VPVLTVPTVRELGAALPREVQRLLVAPHSSMDQTQASLTRRPMKPFICKYRVVLALALLAVAPSSAPWPSRSPGDGSTFNLIPPSPSGFSGASPTGDAA